MIYLFKGSGCKGDEEAHVHVWMHFSICGVRHESKLHENINTFDQKYAPISFLRAGLREFLGALCACGRW